MVSEEFSKQPASSIVRQCHVSNMDTSSIHTEHLVYSRQFQPTIAPHYFHAIGEHVSRPEDAGMVMSSLMDREARKENHQLGVSYGNGHALSLTLGSRLPAKLQTDRHSNALNSDNLSNNNMICESEMNSRVYNTSNCSTHTVDGMASVLSALQSSPYMKPAQQLLDEVVCVSNAVESGSDKQFRMHVEISMDDPRLHHAEEGNDYSLDENHVVHVRISKLVALLHQLERRYKQYFHQMHAVVSSFEAVAGAGAATSYTALTIQAMSKHFSNLRDAIITQLNASRDSISKDVARSHGDSIYHKSARQKRETLQQLGLMQIRQVWRPLRGLPEESVTLLRSWLFEHFLHPYPTDNEKHMLASQTGLSRNQISNWFINARVRLWKPMIEEMYRHEFAEDMPD